MKIFKLFIAFACIAVLCNFSGDVNFIEWTLRKDKEGIKIFTREASNTNVNEVKTVLTINASIDEIANAIIDVENYSNWMGNIINPKILNKVNENEYYLYYEIEIPWPADNRDIINHTIISYDPINSTTLISSIAKPNYIKEKENILRITLSEGSWMLRQLPGNNVEVTHLLLTSAGGNIPNWVNNIITINHPFDTHRNLRKMLE